MHVDANERLYHCRTDKRELEFVILATCMIITITGQNTVPNNEAKEKQTPPTVRNNNY